MTPRPRPAGPRPRVDPRATTPGRRLLCAGLVWSSLSLLGEPVDAARGPAKDVRLSLRSKLGQHAEPRTNQAREVRPDAFHGEVRSEHRAVGAEGVDDGMGDGPDPGRIDAVD